MKLTKIERLILSNQNRILAILDDRNSDNYLYQAEIVENGYEGLYDNLFTNIHEEVSEEVCEETHEILSMYRAINNVIATLTPEQKEGMNIERIVFEGFDGNNDDNYGFMEFIVEKGNLYEEYKGTEMNSHSMSSMMKYKKMLPVYKSAVKSNNYQLNLTGLQAIINSI